MKNIFDIFNPTKSANRIKELEQSNTDWLNRFTQLEEAYNNLKSETETAMLTKEEFNTQLETLKNEYEGKLTGLTSANEASITELKAGYEKQIAELNALKVKELAALKAEMESKLVETEQKIVDVDSKANAKAAEIVSNIGVTEGTVKSGEKPVINTKEIIDTYNKMVKTNPAEAKEYYKLNREQILSALGYR